MMEFEVSRERKDFAAARLTKKQGAAILRLAETLHGSRAAAIRVAIDAGLKQLDSEYAAR
jgi:hypothetical protein